MSRLDLSCRAKLAKLASVTRTILRPLAVLFALAPAACTVRPAPPSIPPNVPAELTTPETPEALDGDELEPDDGEGLGTPAAKVTGWMTEAADKIIAHAQGKDRAWHRLAEMTDRFGPRLSGSKALEQAIDWAVDAMAADGLSNPRREKVMVPHWVRGQESLAVVAPVTRELSVLGLGGTVGTSGALAGPIVVVKDLDDLEAHAAEIKGKIVLIDQKMPAYDHEHRSSGYGTAVRPRSEGASRAAKHGARAVLIRSVTAASLDTPHTGALRYDDGLPRIPAAAVSTEAADFLARLAAKGETRVKLRLGAKHLPDAPSANAVAELRGRELPDEVVLIGAHIDSWDVGTGASDDGAGCVMVMEAARMLKELGLVPRRTIRVVLFTNEENGLAGARAYFAAHGQEKHVAAIEADMGSGAPQGFSIASEDDATVAGLRALAPLFRPLGADQLAKGWGGADISPLIDAGVVGIAVHPEGSHYFDLHHSAADTVDKIDPGHLQGNAAAVAILAYVLAQRE